MSVDPTISKLALDRDLEGATPFAIEQGWQLTRPADLVVIASITRPKCDRFDPEEFIFEFNFDQFPSLPPLISAIDPISGDRDVPRAYPNGHSYFHGNNLICAEWSRRAYGQYQGPHGEWEYSNWKASSNGIISIGPMLEALRGAIFDSTFQGRRG